MFKIQSNFSMYVFQSSPNIFSRFSSTFTTIAAVALAAITALSLAFIFYHQCQTYIKQQAMLLAEKEIEQYEQEKKLQEENEKKNDRNDGENQGHTFQQTSNPQTQQISNPQTSNHQTSNPQTSNSQTNKIQNTWQIGNSFFNFVDPIEEKKKKEEESRRLALKLSKEEQKLEHAIFLISQSENALTTQQNRGYTKQVDPESNATLMSSQQGLRIDDSPSTTTQLNTTTLFPQGNGPLNSSSSGQVQDKTDPFTHQPVIKIKDPVDIKVGSFKDTTNSSLSIGGSTLIQNNTNGNGQTIQIVKIDNSKTQNQVSIPLGCSVLNPAVFKNLLGVINTRSQGAVDVQNLYTKTDFNQTAIDNGGKIPNFILLPGVFRNKAHWYEIGECLYDYHDLLKKNHAGNAPLIMIRGLQIKRVNDTKDYLAKSFLNRKIPDTIPINKKDLPFFPKDAVADCFWFIVNDQDDIILNLKDAQPKYGRGCLTQTEVDPYIEENEKEMNRLIDFLVKNTKGKDDLSSSSDSGQTENKIDLFTHQPVIKIKDPVDIKVGSFKDTTNSSLSIGGSTLIQNNTNGNGQTIQIVKIDNSKTQNQVSIPLGCSVLNPAVFKNLLEVINTRSQRAVDVQNLYTKTHFNQTAIDNGGKIPNFILLPGVFRNKAHWYDTGECLYDYHDLLKKKHAGNVPLIVIKGLSIKRVNDTKDYLAKSFLNRKIPETIPINKKDMPFFPKDAVADCFWFIVNDHDDIIMNLKDAQPIYGIDRFTQTQVDPYIQENEKEMNRLIDFLVKNTKDDPISSSSIVSTSNSVKNFNSVSTSSSKKTQNKTTSQLIDEMLNDF